MQHDYKDISHQFYEELKPLFINYLHKNFTISYDDIMDIYSEVWIDVYYNIKRGMVRKDTKWKSYILQIGKFKASNRATRRPYNPVSYDDERFDRTAFEKEYTEAYSEEPSIYEDPEMHAVLAAELSYIPDPCNKLLKLHYFDEWSMKEVADSMNYRSSRSAISMMNRCRKKLKDRIVNAIRGLGILDKSGRL